jgi:hypothetical protein
MRMAQVTFRVEVLESIGIGSNQLESVSTTSQLKRGRLHQFDTNDKFFNIGLL